MKNVEIRWFGLAALALGLSACEVSVGKCRKDDAGECVDLFEDEDAGDEEDAGEDIDGGRPDAARTDGGVDAGTDGGGGSDASTEPLTLEEFCETQFAKAVLWRDALEDYCSNDNIDERDAFLASTFGYSANDPVGACIDKLDSANITFDSTKAAACAEAFAEQFPEPPDAFPEAGIDLSTYTSTIAHGASVAVQIPTCRAAFKGKLARDAVCTDSFECQEGLRCRAAPGDTVTCQPELEGGVCRRTSECADGFTCVGRAASGGKTCISSDELPIAGNCELSIECAEDRVCSSAGSCVAPSADVICAP